jgi:hypothetical protein
MLEEDVMIGKIERVPLREVWRRENQDLTPWLQENLDVINDITNLSLVTAEREQSAGSFNVDLVAEDNDGRTVIIENQLEKSDHDHLGKLLTYLVAIDAEAAVWIVADPRPEHVNVVNWLNETSTASFYLLKLEAIHINDSARAPLFTLIVGPSEEARQVGETKKELAERHHIRRTFWRSLLERARLKTQLFANISPSIDSWISTGAGKSGFSFGYTTLQHASRIELSIATDDSNQNRQYFEYFQANQADIEEKFGAPLDWDIREGRRACYIRYHLPIGGYRDGEDAWPGIQEKMIEAMVRFERALRPYINQL